MGELDIKIKENTNNDINTANQFQDHIKKLEEIIGENDVQLKKYEDKIEELEDQLKIEKSSIEGISRSSVMKFNKMSLQISSLQSSSSRVGLHNPIPSKKPTVSNKLIVQFEEKVADLKKSQSDFMAKIEQKLASLPGCPCSAGCQCSSSNLQNFDSLTATFEAKFKNFESRVLSLLSVLQNFS